MLAVVARHLWLRLPNAPWGSSVVPLGLFIIVVVVAATVAAAVASPWCSLVLNFYQT